MLVFRKFSSSRNQQYPAVHSSALGLTAFGSNTASLSANSVYRRKHRHGAVLDYSFDVTSKAKSSVYKEPLEPWIEQALRICNASLFER